MKRPIYSFILIPLFYSVTAAAPQSGRASTPAYVPPIAVSPAARTSEPPFPMQRPEDENAGTLEIELVKLLGVSVKDSSEPIGFFGTGLKYAMATAAPFGRLLDDHHRRRTISSRR